MFRPFVGKPSGNRDPKKPADDDVALPPGGGQGGILGIASDDTLLSYLCAHPEAVDIRALPVDSPGVNTLKQAGAHTIVPLVAQGELVGFIMLGPRLSALGYNIPDKQLLNRLSTQAAINLKVALLAETQQKRARILERMAQEMQVAQVVQKTLLPKTLPQVDGWNIDSYWKPAHEVGGDFYDFIHFADGRLGIVIGDVTDKGVPAAIVMASTRSILRTIAMRYVSPGAVLSRVNDLLRPDIPERMFITCLYMVIDPVHGHLRMANAGHNIPILKKPGHINEIMVRGMPLGILPGMEYEEVQLELEPGSTIILYSDGITEARDQSGELFGTRRLVEALGHVGTEQGITENILSELRSFTGSGWEQDDDITLVNAAFIEFPHSVTPIKTLIEELFPSERAHILIEFSLPSLSGNDRVAMEKVASTLDRYSLNEETLERIRTAVAETALNAIEHGNQYQPELPVTLQVLTTKNALSIRISDCGEGGPIPESVTPDLSSKLEGTQQARGWGLFLIRSMVDDMRIFPGETGNTVELLYRLD